MLLKGLVASLMLSAALGKTLPSDVDALRSNEKLKKVVALGVSSKSSFQQLHDTRQSSRLHTKVCPKQGEEGYDPNCKETGEGGEEEAKLVFPGDEGFKIEGLGSEGAEKVDEDVAPPDEDSADDFALTDTDALKERDGKDGALETVDRNAAKEILDLKQKSEVANTDANKLSAEYGRVQSVMAATTEAIAETGKSLARTQERNGAKITDELGKIRTITANEHDKITAARTGEPNQNPDGLSAGKNTKATPEGVVKDEDEAGTEGTAGPDGAAKKG